MSAADKQTWILGEATLSLYPTQADGSPLLSAPIWFGACANGLRIEENWITVERRPSGRQYPRSRPLVPRYAIAIDRLWVVRKSPTADFRTTHHQYVMDIVWDDEEGHWHRKVFYGVTISSRQWSATQADGEFTDEQRFEAEYYIESNMDVAAPPTPPPPVPPATVPMLVWWFGMDGSFPLYVHDLLAYTFTEYIPGISSGRATLAYAPDQSGVFNLTFAAAGLALQAGADEVVHAGDFIQGAPHLSDVPRVEFMIGGTRVASVTESQKLFAWNFTQVDEPGDDANHFLIRAGSDTVLTIGNKGVRADDFSQSL